MSAGSDNPLDPRSYVRGGRIQIRKLGRRGIGALVGAFFSGFVGLFLSIVELPLGLLSGFSSFYGDYIGVWGAVLAQLAEGSITAASQSVLSFGLFGFVVAGLIVGSAVFTFAWVISRAT